MATPNEQTVDTVDARDRTERRNRDQEVMQAAISVMSRQGYAATSVQEIADRVGVLKGSLYHYFSSKEELLFRILLESHEQSQRIARETAELQLSPREELSEFLLRSSLWFLENVDRANIFFREARHLTGERRAIVKQHGRQFWQHLNDLIVAAQAKDEIDRQVDPSQLTEYVLGALNSIREWTRRSALKEVTHREMSQTFVALTLRALGP